MEKTKVLIFIDRLLAGGIQILLFNLISKMDRNKFDFDILTLDDGMTYSMEKNYKEICNKVYKLDGVWLNSPKDIMNYRKKVSEFFKEHHDYSAVHLNSSSKNYMILKYAKNYGIPIRIAHSHSSGFLTESKIKIVLGNLLKNKIMAYSTDLFACSEVSGRWLFGDKAVDDGKVIIIKNGIELDNYKFSIEKYDRMRLELGLCDKIIFGHVGRFSIPKNHKFLLEIFSCLANQEDKAVLLLAGTGDLEDEIKLYAKQLGIENKVIFLGFRNDIANLLQAFDYFIMPSLYEGFPVTGVEAQANGLPCIFSNTITKDIKLTDNVVYYNLEDSAEKWRNDIIDFMKHAKRSDQISSIRKQGYDIDDIAKDLENFYIVK
ncbi:MAG: glycosyltransferase family 1 protein [Erysipelotrichaceae bacterium]